VLLAYAEEDLRGWLTWMWFKHAWEAKGERFTLASVVPPLTPVLVALCRQYLGQEPVGDLHLLGDPMCRDRASLRHREVEAGADGVVGPLRELETHVRFAFVGRGIARSGVIYHQVS